MMAEEQEAISFVRRVRRSYKHLKCYTVSIMSQELAESYARNPDFYSGAFCCCCLENFPVGQNGDFVWEGSNDKVGA